MANKKIIGQRIMDLFYQTYKTNSDFFDIEDFTYYAGIGWAKFIQLQYEKQYAQRRSEGETSETISITFPPQFLQSQELAVKYTNDEYVAEITNPIMAFQYDQQNIGIQNIFPVGNAGCGELIRTNIDKIWHFCYLPTTSKRFWYLDLKEIKFLNVGKCNLKKVRVLYVPSSDDDNLDIPDTAAFDVIDLAMIEMKKASNGMVVPQVNDLNTNAIAETQIDRTQLTKQP